MIGVDSATNSPSVVTVTCTVPVPPGAVSTMEVPAELMLVMVAADPPKETVEPVVNPAPVMVTVVPPVAGPDDGEIAVTAGMYVNLASLPVGDAPDELDTVNCTVPVPPGVTADMVVPS